FAEADGEEFLLVASHAGRRVFDLAGNRIAQVPAHGHISDEWHDTAHLRVLGIGPLDGRWVAIAGLWGGGLPTMTFDGWGVERVAVDWPDERILLTHPYPSRRKSQIHEERSADVRAVGFAPSGRALIVATSAEFILFAR